MLPIKLGAFQVILKVNRKTLKITPLAAKMYHKTEHYSEILSMKL